MERSNLTWFFQHPPYLKLVLISKQSVFSTMDRTDFSASKDLQRELNMEDNIETAYIDIYMWRFPLCISVFIYY